MNSNHTAATLEAEGWKLRELSGYVGLIGPLWTRKETSGWAYGILTGHQHLNPANIVHGGLLMSLLDHALSSIAWESTGRQTCVTVQMDAKFMASAGTGQFLRATGHITGTTSTMVFAHGDIQVEDRVLLSATALLKILQTSK